MPKGTLNTHPRMELIEAEVLKQIIIAEMFWSKEQRASEHNQGGNQTGSESNPRLYRYKQKALPVQIHSILLKKVSASADNS